MACLTEQFFGRIDPNSRNPGSLQHPAETALATTDIERSRELAIVDALQHWTVHNVGATVIAFLAHLGDPRRRRFGPSRGCAHIIAHLAGLTNAPGAPRHIASVFVCIRHSSAYPAQGLTNRSHAEADYTRIHRR